MIILIEIRNLDKVYKSGASEIQAVKNVNLKIEENDIYGIMGLSGAGKSTLIRMLNRLEDATSGEILVLGENILDYDKKKLRDYRKKTGMIFQHFNLLQSRDVKGNVAFALEIAGWKKSDIPGRVRELLDLVGLADKADAYPAQLSGGQKQRVAIARALSNHPKILLSDEATSALDPKTTKAILELLKDIQKKLGITIVLITHQMEVIRSVCNKAAIMYGGEVIEEGPTEEIFLNPKTDIAKEFVEHTTHEEKSEVELVKSSGRKIIKLLFKGQLTTAPVLAGMIRNYDVDPNILAGNIDELTTTRVGHLVVELQGEIKNQEASIEWLGKQGVGVEVLYNG